MQATSFEFRYRFWIFVVIYTLGFTAPWDYWLHLDGSGPNAGAPGQLAGWGGNAHAWGLLAALLAGGGTIGVSAAFNLVLAVAIVFAFAGAWLRTWGAAYLGTGVVHDARLRGDAVVADGPYRHVRNPLYLGTWLNTLALAILMPASGAIFCIVLVVFFQLRLILGEEAFLRAKLGEPYVAYLAKVPRLWFSLRARVPAPEPTSLRDVGHPNWVQAALTEIFLWGTAVSFAVLGWRYDAMLLIQCVLVWLGVSFIVKAFAGREPRTP